MTLYHNANIYAPERPQASAVVVDHGHFMALGPDDEILARYSREHQVVDLHGLTVWPGLIDAHIHLKQLAETLSIVDCETATRQACLEGVKRAARMLPEDAWVRGHGWNQNRWENGFGTARMLDEVCGHRPAYLTAKSLHAAWANSAALRLAGISKDTVDPPGGAIQRDQDGHPTGILFEAGAMQMVEAVIPQPSHAENVARINAVLPHLWRAGLVGLHDFDDFACWLALQEIFQTGQTPLRITKNIPADHLEVFISAGLRTGFGDDRLNVGSLKLFSDGALGPQTAAMQKPYEGSQETGSLLMHEDEIFEIGTKAVAHGIALAVHAIGDRANHIVLNALERLRAYEADHQLPHLPHRIEHVQILDPEDVHRFAGLGVVASVQPVHAPSDMQMADRFLGPRARNAYAYRSLLEAGAEVIFGSDAPVEPFNPFYGLHAAVTRRRLDGSPGESGWQPEQRLSLGEALYGFTSGPAIVAGKGGRLGKIAPFYHADFLLLEQDPFKLDPHDLGRITPLATFIAGECKYQAENLPLKVQPGPII